MRRRSPVRFDIVAVNLDQKQPGFPAHVLPQYLSGLGIPFHIETRDTYSIVKRLIPEGETTCSLCSRLRRGHLYRLAAELGATKIALGHHRDDVLETLLLNLFFTGKLKAMPPKLRSKDGRHVIIRPLAYVRERDLARYAELKSFPIIPCDLCGSQEDLKRREMKGMLAEWEERFPGCQDSMAAALANVAPSLLLDRRLFDFGTV
jgi:tRNA 2-thiocytidine biosynthesis protein TtcA